MPQPVVRNGRALYTATGREATSCRACTIYNRARVGFYNLQPCVPGYQVLTNVTFNHVLLEPQDEGARTCRGSARIQHPQLSGASLVFFVSFSIGVLIWGSGPGENLVGYHVDVTLEEEIGGLGSWYFVAEPGHPDPNLYGRQCAYSDPAQCIPRSVFANVWHSCDPSPQAPNTNYAPKYHSGGAVLELYNA